MFTLSAACEMDWKEKSGKLFKKLLNIDINHSWFKISLCNVYVYVYEHFLFEFILFIILRNSSLILF